MNESGEPQPNTPLRSPEGNEKIDLRILIADDESGMRGLLEMVLGMKYTSVESENDGKSLLSKLSDPTYKVDFIITDNTMPGLTGLEAIREIRKIDRFKNTPIILFTSDTGGIKEEAESADVNAFFLAKPFKNIQELYDVIEKLRQQH